MAFIVFALAGAGGLAVTSAQAFLTWLFRRRRFFAGRLRRQADGSVSSLQDASTIPPRFVSILKPVCGLDDELEANLESFTRLRGVRHEIILSVADPADPALGVIERVRSCFPNAPFRLVIGGDPALELGNRKVARLVAAAAKARGDILMVSDSNVRVRPFDVAETIAAFDDERVGCVSNLFTGTGAADFGARIESLHLLSFVAPGSVLAAFAGVPCVVGKSMAVTCEALMSIGGFRRFANVLAEDQAMGLAVQAAGFRVALSPAVVRNVVVRRTLRRAVDRQIRWNKIRYAFSKVTYTAELLTLPLPFTILAALTGGLAGLTWPCVLPAVAAVIRIAQLALLARVTRAPLTLRDLALVPLFDLLQFGAQFVPYVDNSVTWRGFRVRIGADTVLLHEDRTPLAA